SNASIVPAFATEVYQRRVAELTLIVRGYAYREVRGREPFQRRDWAGRHGLTGPWRPFCNISICCQRLTQAVHLKKSYCHSVLARERDCGTIHFVSKRSNGETGRGVRQCRRRRH